MANQKLSVISLFTGAMGLDLGLEKAGFAVRVALECNKFAIETIKANRPDLPLITDKIENVTTQQILEKAGLKPGEAALVVGGPSCQPFSTAGQRHSVSDPRGEMFKEFLRVVREARPRFFIMENVRGVLSAAIKHRPLKQRGPGFPPLSQDEQLGSAFKLILSELQDTGYYVMFDLLNAADYGVPQMRERLVFIGSRDGELLKMPEQTHAKEPTKGRKRWLTLRAGLRRLNDEQPTFHEFVPRNKKYMSRIPPGGNWRSLPKPMQAKAIGGAYKSWGGRCGFLRRLSWQRCPPALTTAPDGRATMLCHPDELRSLSTKEYAKLQQFPARWKFAGGVPQQYIQIGNAVPVGLGQALGKAIRKVMRKRKGNKALKGKVACTNTNLLERLAKRPTTIINPKRMRKIKGDKATRAWLSKSRHDRSEILQLIFTPNAEPHPNGAQPEGAEQRRNGHCRVKHRKA